MTGFRSSRRRPRKRVSRRFAVATIAGCSRRSASSMSRKRRSSSRSVRSRRMRSSKVRLSSGARSLSSRSIAGGPSGPYFSASSLSRVRTSVPRLATGGSAWKPDSCCRTATTAQTRVGSGGSPASEKAARRSFAQPAGSPTPSGNAARTCAGPSGGDGRAGGGDGDGASWHAVAAASRSAAATGSSGTRQPPSGEYSERCSTSRRGDVTPAIPRFLHDVACAQSLVGPGGSPP